jgi:hypothetical protein
MDCYPQKLAKQLGSNIAIFFDAKGRIDYQTTHISPWLTKI